MGRNRSATAKAVRAERAAASGIGQRQMLHSTFYLPYKGGEAQIVVDLADVRQFKKTEVDQLAKLARQGKLPIVSGYIRKLDVPGRWGRDVDAAAACRVVTTLSCKLVADKCVLHSIGDEAPTGTAWVIVADRLAADGSLIGNGAVTQFESRYDAARYARTLNKCRFYHGATAVPGSAIN